ncbi:MAG: SDR family oxidoreductase [Rhodobacteraceae bacterium]|jgi:nucleoside-diphosphate-sugar epimerase|nr:SDR family oxidoreductase [Paracoccaceae bacterium]
MHILLIGAAGMIGRKLALRLAADGAIGATPIAALDLVDVVLPPVPAGLAGRVTAAIADLSAPGTADRLAATRPDLVIHLAAIVSGEAEVDLGRGYRVNLDGTRALLDALVATGTCPRVIFASSTAVFGPPFPARIPDDFAPRPATSYGTQKLMAELLVSDLSRRGLIDGISLRLPTICVRPGAPNRAASGFFSGILREPLAGLPADLPVADATRHYFASPRAAVGFILHAATLDTAGLGHARALTMPGLSATVGDQIDALRRIAGPSAVALIRRTADPLVARIVAGWAADFDAAHARALGFAAETDMDAILRVHVEDELGGRLTVAPV